MRARRLASGLVLAALAASSGPAQQPSRTHLATVELAGPLERVELDFPESSGATLELRLSKGERRTLTLPLAAPGGAPQAIPEVRAIGGGTARFAGWLQSDVARLAQEWERLPPGLRLRPRPPAPESRGAPEPPAAALLLACAGFLLALRWRSRAIRALSIGALAASAVFAAASRRAPVRTILRLLEGDGASGSWIAVVAAREHLSVQPSPALRVQTQPARAALRVRVSQPRGELLWSLEAARTTIYQTEVLELASGALTRAGPNRLGALAAAWVREADGEWTRRGRWELGEPLPGPLPGAGDPPGWINPALPLGTGILIGELDPAPSGAEQAYGEPRVEAWVRVVGF